MNNIAITVALLFAVLSAGAQTNVDLSIDSCYAMAKRQYPMIKQRGLIEKTKDYNIQNASRGYLPQFSVNGQYTYQSAVTTIALPAEFKNLGFSIPTPPKDQYNIHAELDQTIYDGGSIHDQKLLEQTNADVQQSDLQVTLYALRDRINQIYFGVLLMDAQMKQNDIQQKDIQSSIEKTQATVTNGMALQSSVDELQAELLQQEQNKIGLQASRKAYIDMLSVFIGKPLDANTTLQNPASITVSDNIKRPELTYYDAQRKSYDIQDRMLTTSILPKLSFYVQGGVALPGLNAFDTKSEPYYIGGLKLSWQLGGLYTMKNQRAVYTLNRQTIDIQKETFLFNTSITLKQQSTDITKLQEMISKDNEIISKRTAVKDAAQAQMANGTITVHEYINQLDAEDQAKQNLLLHQVQMLMALYDYQNTSGN